MKHTDGGLRCKENGYIRKGIPPKKEMGDYKEKGNKCENRELSYKEISTLLINTRSILGPARGEVYTELLAYSLLFVT